MATMMAMKTIKPQTGTGFSPDLNLMNTITTIIAKAVIV